jgi:hypothetical protein
MHRHISFWLAVAGVSVLANAGVTFLSHKVNSPGLSRLVAYAHSSGGA